MVQQERVAKRLLEAGAIAAAALCLWTLPAAAQSRQRPNNSGDGGGRVAVRSAPSAPSSGAARGGGSAPRTAHPVDGSNNSGPPDRQRPHNGGGGHDGGGHHGGYYHGYYGNPYYYGGWGWGWGAWSWWPGYWGYGYAPYYGYYGPSYGGGGGYYGDYSEGGALDLDVAPGRTQVFVDGNLLGTVDAYDGFPRYLWLEKGTYDIAFYLDGYKTISRQVTIYPGTVIDVGDRMELGESVRPEDLVTKTHERRDARIRDEQERREQIREEEEDWHDRVQQDRERHRGEYGESDEDGRDRHEDERSPTHGQVHLDIEPADASVYLDGRFVGTAEQLARAGLSVNPGQHQLSVVRPGFDSEEVEFNATAGEEVELEVDLDHEDGSR
ncbi:MAG TPA: PEGA domain-containing protein [Thermoanaerobaculia bacterium]|nr:PEGA domain-containing protein [Thermoanaerobaculia bacterium]